MKSKVSDQSMGRKIEAANGSPRQFDIVALILGLSPFAVLAWWYLNPDEGSGKLLGTLLTTGFLAYSVFVRIGPIGSTSYELTDSPEAPVRAKSGFLTGWDGVLMDLDGFDFDSKDTSISFIATPQVTTKVFGIKIPIQPQNRQVFRLSLAKYDDTSRRLIRHTWRERLT